MVFFPHDANHDRIFYDQPEHEPLPEHAFQFITDTIISPMDLRHDDMLVILEMPRFQFVFETIVPRQRLIKIV